MPNQTVGVLLVTLGFWVSYCGVYGLPVWQTLVDIIKNPGAADKTLDAAKKRASIRLAADSGTLADGMAETYARNPYVGRKVSQTYSQHKSADSGAPGVDWIAPVGTPLVAIWSGVVTNKSEASAPPGYGNTISITRDNGDVYEYLHASSFKILNGTKVKAGSIVGLSGGSAGAPGSGKSSGPHIHLHYIKKGSGFIDPLGMITGAADNRNRAGGGSF